MYDEINDINNTSIPDSEIVAQGDLDDTSDITQNTPNEKQPLMGWYDPYDGTYHYNSVPKDTIDPHKDDKRWPTVQSASFFFLIMLGIQLAFSSFISTINTLFENVPSGVLYGLTALISIVSLGVPLLIYVKKYNAARKDLLRLNRVSFGSIALVLLISILAFIANYMLTQAWIYLVSFIGTPILTDIPNPTSAVGIIIMVLSICVIPPVLEELCFRGVLQRGLEGRGARYSIIMCGVLFALMHMSFVSAPPKILLGIILAYTAYVTNSVWCPVIIHAVNNIAATVISFLPSSTQAASVEEALNIPVMDKISLILIYLGISAVLAIVIFSLLSALRRMNSHLPRHRYRTDAELYNKKTTQIIGIKIAVIIIVLNILTEIGLMVVNDLNLLDYFVL